MNTKFYLSGVEIEQPEGINGLYLERIRDKVFGGFIRKRTSSIKGIGSVKITDLEVCQILKSEFEANGIDGVTEFSIIQNNEAIYISEVDYAQYSVNQNGHATIAFRDPQGIVEFDSNLDKEYEIEPSSSIFLDKTELTGKSTHSINPLNVVSRGQPNGKPFLFSIPLKVNAKDSVTNGIGLDVVALEDLKAPFWQNNDTKPVKISVGGLLKFTVSGSSNDNITIAILSRINSIVSEKITIFQFSSNTTPQTRTVILDKVITVGVGGDVCLIVEGTDSIQGYNYTFETADVSVSQDLEFTGSTISGLLATTLLSKLIEKISEGKLSFVDESFVTISPFITNGWCLRANNRPIKTSFFTVFKGLCKIYNLALSIEGNTVFLRNKDVNYKRSGAFPLNNTENVQITSLIKTAMSDKFLTEIKVGYGNWKSDTILGNLEFNSTRTYDTSIKKTKSVLDLTVNEFVASGKMIEKQRRLQYEILKSNEKTDDKNDDTLFIIDTLNGKSIVGTNGINEGINPVVILKNHTLEHGHCKTFIYRTGDGNVTAEVLGEVQNKDFTELPKTFTGMQMMVEGSCDLLTYMSFDDKMVIDFQGQPTELWIDEDLYRLQTNSFTIKGFEIAK